MWYQSRTERKMYRSEARTTTSLGLKAPLPPPTERSPEEYERNIRTGLP